MGLFTGLAPMTSYYGVVPLLAALFNVVTAVIVFRRDAVFKINRRFSYLCVALAVWNAGYFAESWYAGDVAGRLFWSKISHAAGLLASSIALHFIGRFTRTLQARRPPVLAVSYALSGLVCLTLFFTPWVIRSVLPYKYGFHAAWGALYSAYLAVLVFNYMLLFFLLLRAMRTTSLHIERNRLRYILYGSLIVVCTSLTNFLPALGYGVHTLGNLGSLLFMVLVLFGIYKHRLMNLRLAIAKYLLLALFWVLIGAAYSAIVFVIARAWPVPLRDEHPLLFNFLVIGLFVVVFQMGLRYVLPRIEGLVYPLKSDLRRLLERLDEEMLKSYDAKSAVNVLLSVTFNAITVPSAGVYLKERRSGRFELAGALGAGNSALGRGFDASSVLAWCLDAVIREEVRRDLALENFGSFARETMEELVAEMDRLHVEVAVPLIADTESVGLLCFGKKRFGGVYDMDDVGALKLLAGRTASAIANIAAISRLREKENLALIGEMTASIAHEIKNPLGVIKGAADTLLLNAADDKTRKFSGMVVDESARLDRIVRQFLQFARPAEAALSAMDCAASSRRCCELFLAEDARNRFSIRVTGAETPLIARADPDFFKQIFFNLAKNSREARSDGEFVVSFEENAASLTIVFSDNCGGMPEETAERVFDPFFTTKTDGTGLGMAIVKKLVSLMGGVVSVHARAGQGTDIRVSLKREGERQ